MKHCTEKLIAMTLVLMGIFALAGSGGLAMLLILIPTALVLACLLAPLRQQKITDSSVQKG